MAGGWHWAGAQLQCSQARTELCQEPQCGTHHVPSPVVSEQPVVSAHSQPHRALSLCHSNVGALSLPQRDGNCCFTQERAGLNRCRGSTGTPAAGLGWRKGTTEPGVPPSASLCLHRAASQVPLSPLSCPV
uniref:Uncharacterized protein n=1 Tax=Zonotrichia albicollis TaxID=44394 RepID=A0A8D2NBH1_ZONAL